MKFEWLRSALLRFTARGDASESSLFWALMLVTIFVAVIATMQPDGMFVELSASPLQPCASQNTDVPQACLNASSASAARTRVLVPDNLDTHPVGSQFSQILKITSTGYIPISPTFSIYSRSLPPGLMLSNGKLFGVLSKAGTFTFDIHVEDANGFAASKTYTMLVTP